MAKHNVQHRIVKFNKHQALVFNRPFLLIFNEHSNLYLFPDNRIVLVSLLSFAIKTG
jgi:hypothetical protein